MQMLKDECLWFLNFAIDRFFGILISLFWISVVLFVCLVGFQGPARAAETFVCAAGSTVTVQSNQIEWMKRTNACVARYYGLEVGDDPGGASSNATVGRYSVPLPERRPQFISAALKAQKALRDTAGMVTGSVGELDAADERGTFRRVLILNAAPGKSRWYNHTR